MNRKKRYTLLIPLLLFLMQLNASPIIWNAGLDFPENAEIRHKYRDLLFAQKKEVLAESPMVHAQIESDVRVFFQVTQQKNAYYLLFTNEKEYKFPLYSKGSYIVKRSDVDDSFIQIKIFTKADPDSFVRIFPFNDRSRMDVILFGVPIYEQVTLPFTFEQVLLEPFSRVVEVTEAQIDWSLILNDTSSKEDGNQVKMIAELRKNLPLLNDSDDGALDADGTFKFIEDLTQNLESGFNCSGFAKWVVDGVLVSQNSGIIDIESLKQKHVELRGNHWSRQFEDERDPYFGLDWTRNLALAANSTYSGGIISPEANDVRSVPFFEYIEDVGYPIRALRLILYVLSKKDPGYFYLASINRDYGENPVLRQHIHIAALFPYFDDTGEFRIAVMERNVETSVSSLERRYSEDFVHLVKIETPEVFQALLVE
jgi:hypothetical protein